MKQSLISIERGLDWGLFFVSLSFLFLLFLGFSLKPNWMAALTFIPAWIWTAGGALMSLISTRIHVRRGFALFFAWTAFGAIFSEEPYSVLRGAFDWDRRWEDADKDRRLRIVSLNCAGGKSVAVREAGVYQPDIVLLQETPRNLAELRRIGKEFFGDHASVLLGHDTAILSRYTIEAVEAEDAGASEGSFLVHGKIRLADGGVMHLLSVRLSPPCVEVNLFNPDVWRSHAHDRRARVRQTTKIVECLAAIPPGEVVILGGDFNVPANDGSLRPLREKLRDAFQVAGVGWGHTATNELPLFRVDQIWVSARVNPVATMAHPTSSSDHRMVVCHVVVD